MNFKMILFKKKLFLTALFTVSAGISIISNSSATNNQCPCCRCHGQAMTPQDGNVSQQLVDQVPGACQQQLVEQPQWMCQPNGIGHTYSNFYLHGGFFPYNSGYQHGTNPFPYPQGGNQPHCDWNPHGGNQPHTDDQQQNGSQSDDNQSPNSGQSQQETPGQEVPAQEVPGQNVPGDDNPSGENDQQPPSSDPQSDPVQQPDVTGDNDGNQQDDTPFDSNQSQIIYEPDKFDCSQLKCCSCNDEVINGYWQLLDNCSVDKSFSMENSTFEVTKGKRFEAPFNSMTRVNMDTSTLFINTGGRFIYQSNNFNTFTDGSKVVFGPYSRLIWNGSNYRLFDASNDTSFIIYPKAFINALKFDVVHKHHVNYLIDGNNEQSTLYLNRIDPNSKENHDIMAAVLDMNVVLPSGYSESDLKLDQSKQFLKCEELYPNLYFENCKFSFKDYQTSFDKEKITDWLIKSNSKDYTGNKRAVLSCIEKMLDYNSPDGSKFAEYDIEFKYAEVKNVQDNRDSFSIYPNKYNIKSVVINEKKYNCNWDLSKLYDCFKDSETYRLQIGSQNTVGIFNYIPRILCVGLIGNQNIRMFDKTNGMDYKQVHLYGDNTEYSGVISTSENTENVVFGEYSYADIDQLFKVRTNKNQCNCEFKGSNKIKVNGQTINNLIVTKDARIIKFVLAKDKNNAQFNVKGIITFEAYDSDSDAETDSGDSFVVEEGVEVNA